MNVASSVKIKLSAADLLDIHFGLWDPMATCVTIQGQTHFIERLTVRSGEERFTVEVNDYRFHTKRQPSASVNQTWRKSYRNKITEIIAINDGYVGEIKTFDTGEGLITEITNTRSNRVIYRYNHNR